MFCKKFSVEEFLWGTLFSYDLLLVSDQNRSIFSGRYILLVHIIICRSCEPNRAYGDIEKIRCIVYAFRRVVLDDELSLSESG